MHKFYVIYSHSPRTGLVGLHYCLVDFISGSVGVSVGLLPLVELLFNGPQSIVDLGGCGVCQICSLLCLIDLLGYVCSSQRNQVEETSSLYSVNFV